MAKGTVLRIEKSSIHDGPGIRTIVFLKGCPMRCIWCSTPESHLSSVQVGYVRRKCTGCRMCREVCRQNAIEAPGNSVETPGNSVKTPGNSVKTPGNAIEAPGNSVEAPGNLVVRHTERCTGCGACARACPNGALTIYGKDMTSEQVMDEVRKDEVFYYHSGGGVTLSGGEPLYQPEFSGEILSQCKSEGIHTAVETSLYSPYSDISGLLGSIDFLYVDLKHADPDEHRRLTGVDNSLILENLGRLDSSGFAGDLIIRIPLVPGLNDGDRHFDEVGRICSGLRKLKGIEILPYHRLGLDTYGRLGMACECSSVKAPDASRVADRIGYLSERCPGIVDS